MRRDASKTHAHGELQRRIMQVAWSRPEFTIRQVHEVLAKDGRVAYTTVQTVMGRLVDRGFLERDLRGNVGYYRAATSSDRDEVAELLDQLFGRFGSLAVSQFVRRTQADPKLFDRLRRLVERASDRG